MTDSEYKAAISNINSLETFWDKIEEKQRLENELIYEAGPVKVSQLCALIEHIKTLLE
jgi:hypothetical protein